MVAYPLKPNTTGTYLQTTIPTNTKTLYPNGQHPIKNTENIQTHAFIGYHLQIQHVNSNGLLFIYKRVASIYFFDLDPANKYSIS